MTEQVRADPAAIARLARTTLTAADEMSDAWSAAQGVVVPPATAFGDSSCGGALASAVATAEATTDEAWRYLAQVHESDVDKLYRVAFAYQQADAAAEDRLHR